MSKIIFFNMNGCGHCARMKKQLDPYIQSGMVELVDAKNAGGRFDGFPAFEYNGKSAVGAMDVEALFAKLGFSHPGASAGPKATRQQPRENYGCGGGAVTSPIHENYGCGGGAVTTPIHESFGHTVSHGNYNNYARYHSQNKGYARGGDL